jgi:ribosomal protein L44E
LFLNPERHIVLSVKHIHNTKLLNTRREKKAQLLKEEEDTIENNQVLNTLKLGYGGQTKPIFRKKAKTTKKITLRL